MERTRQFVQARSRREPQAARLLVELCVLGFGIHCWQVRPSVVDDAAISIAYGQSFFSGAGLRLNPVSQVVEGFSNPLWVLLSGLSVPLGFDPVSFTQVLGLLLAMAALPLFAAWGPLGEDRELRVEDAAVGIAGMVSALAVWAGSGMETGLQVFLLGLCGALMLREIESGKGHLSGLALGLLCLTRPEGVLYLGVAGILWLVSLIVERQRPGRRELYLCLWVVGLVGGYELLRWVYFRDILPNTFYAKRLRDFYAGFSAANYVSGFFRAHIVLGVSALVGVVLGCIGSRETRRRALLAGGFVLAGLFFCWRAKGDWMHEWRFIAPLVPAMAAAIAAGVSGLRDRFGHYRRAPAWLWPSFAGALVLGLGWTQLGVAVARSAKVRPTLPYEKIALHAQDISRCTEKLGLRRPVLAVPDIGGVSMELRHAEVVDPARLADRALAFHGMNYAAAGDYLLSEGPPDVVDIHGPSRWLERIEGFKERYVPIRSCDPGLAHLRNVFVLAGLSADADPRCPQGKSQILGLSKEALMRQMGRALEAGKAQEAVMAWRCAYRYHRESALPELAERVALAERAAVVGEVNAREGKLKEAVRAMSLASLLSGDPQLRRGTEVYRGELFADAEPAALPAEEPEAAPAACRLLFDFEGDLKGWQLEGRAFAKQPSGGATGGQNTVRGFVGEQLLNTFDRVAGDRLRGVATSPPFVLEGRTLSFFVGGGDMSEVAVELVVNGKVIRSARGKRKELLEQVDWKVAHLRGKQAQLRVVDRAGGIWGHILFDHAELCGLDPPAPAKGDAAAKQGGSRQRAPAQKKGAGRRPAKKGNLIPRESPIAPLPMPSPKRAPLRPKAR